MVTINAMRITPPNSLLLVLLGLLVLSRTSGAAISEDGGEREAQSSDLADIKFRSSNLYPESFAWDAKHNRFLVGSIRHGKLVAVAMDGAVEDFVTFDETVAGFGIVGVTVDAERNRVLAVVHGFTEQGLDALVGYNLDSKEQTLFVDLVNNVGVLDANVENERPMSRDVANDVTVDSDGNAYVTNSGGNSIWKVEVGRSTAIRMVVVPQLPVVADTQLARQAGTNGILYTSGYLLVGQSNSGRFFRVSLDEDRQSEDWVLAVKVRDGKLIIGADGLALRSDGSLVVVSEDAAWLLTSKDSWRTATIADKVALNPADFTTGVAVVGQRVFTLQLYVYDFVKGVEREIFTIREVKFPHDSDNNPLWLMVIFAIFVLLIVVWKYHMNYFNEAYTKKRS